MSPFLNGVVEHPIEGKQAQHACFKMLSWKPTRMAHIFQIAAVRARCFLKGSYHAYILKNHYKLTQSGFCFPIKMYSICNKFFPYLPLIHIISQLPNLAFLLLTCV